MPDLESFLVSAKNQEDLKSGIARKKKKKGGEDDEEDDDYDQMIALAIQKNTPAGTKSRPGNAKSEESSFNG